MVSKMQLQLEEKKNVFLTSAFKDYLFECKMLVLKKIAEFLEVKPGMRVVVDACAGAGGKTFTLLL